MALRASDRQIVVGLVYAGDEENRIWGSAVTTLHLEKAFRALGLSVWRASAHDLHAKPEYSNFRTDLLISEGVPRRHIPPTVWANSQVRAFWWLSSLFYSFDTIASSGFDCVATNSRKAERVLRRLKIPSSFIELAAPDRPRMWRRAEYSSFAVYLGGYPHKSMRQMKRLFDPAGQYDFAIWGRGWSRSPFKPFYRGVLPLGDELSLYRSCKAVLALTEKNQKRMGMINNRIFEALACGRPVISDDFPALASHPVGKFIHFAASKRQAACLLARLKQGKFDVKAAQAQKFVLKHHTYRNRAAEFIGLFHDAMISRKSRKETHPAGTVRTQRGPSVSHDMAQANILLLSSNGIGMGHLIRSLAIARRFGAGFDPVIATMSQSFPAIQGFGFPVEYIMSQAYTRQNHANWTSYLRSRLSELISKYNIAAIAFDGNHPYSALTDIHAAYRRLPFYWVRRAMWRADANPAPLQKHIFDLIVEPEDLAEAADAGPTVAFRNQVVKVRPVRLLDPSEMLSRNEARRILGLDEHRPACLVLLGSGNNFQHSPYLEIIKTHFAGHPDWQVVSAQWMIGENSGSIDGWMSLRSFPFARYFKAFNFAISHGGYNSFHEVLAANLPAIFVANDHPTQDDQEARGRWADAQGLALFACLNGPTTIRDCLHRMMNPKTREVLASASARLQMENGAGSAANIIESHMTKNMRLVRDGGPFPVHAVPPSGKYLLHKDPSRLFLFGVIMLGAERSQIERTVAGLEHRQILSRDFTAVFLTDSIDLDPLRKAGFGFEFFDSTSASGAEVEHRIAQFRERWQPQVIWSIGKGAERLNDISDVERKYL